MPKELTRINHRALQSARARTFTKYKLVVGVPMVLFNTAVLFGGPAIVGLLGVLEVGWAGWVAALPALALALLVTCKTTLLGNIRLKRGLAQRLGLNVRSLEFVGIARMESNDPFAMRVETDDNVGFLHMGRGELRIITEDAALVIAQDDLRGFSLERVASLPYLSWIRIEHETDAGPVAFLMMSREARNLIEQRRRTRALYARLVDWHATRQLAWHETFTRRSA